jgi:hypothetical protein
MRDKYSGLQIGIHWLVFLLVIGAYAAMELRGFFPQRAARHQYDSRLLRDFYFCSDGGAPVGASQIPGAANCACRRR